MKIGTLDLHSVRTQRYVVTDGVGGQCHASTLCALDDGFVVGWFEGDQEGAPNSRIWTSVGKCSSWSRPSVVSGGLGPCWNPVLHVQRTGRILLYFKVGDSISSWTAHVVESGDGGRTWSAPGQVRGCHRGGCGPVRTSPVRLASGRLVAGASTESWGREPRWDAHVDLSDDDGRTWVRGDPVAFDRASFSGAGMIQPTLWQSEDGAVRLLARSTYGYLVASVSRDEGESWSAGRLSTVPNNNSGVSASSREGLVYLAHNPVSGNWAPRSPLVVSVSSDDGETWDSCVTLEASVAETAGATYSASDSGVTTTGVGEYSYPSLVATADGLFVTYTWQRRGIRLAYIQALTKE